MRKTMDTTVQLKAGKNMKKNMVFLTIIFFLLNLTGCTKNIDKIAPENSDKVVSYFEGSINPKNAKGEYLHDNKYITVITQGAEKVEIFDSNGKPIQIKGETAYNNQGDNIGLGGFLNRERNRKQYVLKDDEYKISMKNLVKFNKEDRTELIISYLDGGYYEAHFEYNEFLKASEIQIEISPLTQNHVTVLNQYGELIIPKKNRDQKELMILNIDDATEAFYFWPEILARLQEKSNKLIALTVLDINSVSIFKKNGQAITVAELYQNEIKGDEDGYSLITKGTGRIILLENDDYEIKFNKPNENIIIQIIDDELNRFYTFNSDESLVLHIPKNHELELTEIERLWLPF